MNELKAPTDDEISVALRLIKFQYKSENNGIDESLQFMIKDEQRKGGLWIPHGARSFDRETAVVKLRGMHPGNIDGTVYAKEYMPFITSDAHLRPDAIVDAEVSVPRRIQKFYDRKLFYPHIQVPKIYLHDHGAGNPYLIIEKIPGDDYKTLWGNNVESADFYNMGIGCIGWSYRQKRRFVRKMALYRIMFLFIRSTKIRGAGDHVPLLNGPLHRVYYEAFFSKPHSLGPWDNVENMLIDIFHRECDYYLNMDPDTQRACGYDRFIDNPQTLHAAFQTSLKFVQDNAHRTRQKENEIDPVRPFVLCHGDLTVGFNIMMNSTNITGIIDFERSAYLPYSAAIADLTNQFPTINWAGSAQYINWKEWENQRNKPFKVEEDDPFAIYDWSFKEYHSQNSHSDTETIFTMNNRKGLRRRWGEINWEDLVYGDRFDVPDDMYDDKPPAPFNGDDEAWMDRSNFTKEGHPLRGWDSEADRVTPEATKHDFIGCRWFTEPVAFLVTQFVETYLNPDPLGKWQDPLFATVFHQEGCDLSRETISTAGRRKSISAIETGGL